MSKHTIAEALEIMYDDRKERHKELLINHGVNDDSTIKKIKRDFYKNMPNYKMPFGKYLDNLRAEIEKQI